MKNSKMIFLTVLIVLGCCFGCIREDDKDDRCHQTIYLYSLDRERNDVLQKEVLSGELFAYSNGQLVHSELLNPVPQKVQLNLPEGTYDVVVTGNVSSGMEYNRTPVGADKAGSIRYKQQDSENYMEADDVHLGKLEGYVMNDRKRDLKDSLHVKRMVGRMTVILNKMVMNPDDYYCELVISGTAHGVDFYQNLTPDSVYVKTTGEINNNRVQLDALCFASLIPLKIQTKLINKHNGNLISVVEKILPEPMGPNKWIIAEYDFSGGGFVELEIVVKDWDGSGEQDSGIATTN